MARPACLLNTAKLATQTLALGVGAAWVCCCIIAWWGALLPCHTVFGTPTQAYSFSIYDVAGTVQ